MNKLMEMGKTMFEVMKMRKNNKKSTVGLRKKYYNNTDDAIIMTLKLDVESAK